MGKDDSGSIFLNLNGAAFVSTRICAQNLNCTYAYEIFQTVIPIFIRANEGLT